MPPTPVPAPAPAARKHYFYYGHRRPSQNRPVVRGGLFTNRTDHKPRPAPSSFPPVHFSDWDPSHPSPPPASPAPSLPASARRLSPLARYVVDSLRRHARWGPPLLADLSKLRRLTPDALAEVLRSRPLLDPALSTRLFHWAGRQKGFRHSFASFNALAYSLNDARLPRAADQLPDLMTAHGRAPSEKQLEILVRMHADARRGLRLFHIYKKMRSKFGIKPRIFLFNRILDGLVKSGHLDLALSVYTDIEADGLQSEAITYTVLAKGLCRAGRVDGAIEMLEKMRKELCQPDVFTYTAMVKVLAAEGNLEGCLRIWEEMTKDGVQPDVMAYATLVMGLCKDGRVEEGCDLFEEMKRKGLLIDRAVYGALVDGFVAEGKVEAGCELLKEMVQGGYRADLAIYNSLIGGFCSAKKADKAYKLFQVVIREDLTPSFETVTPLLASFVETNGLDKFFQLVDKIRELGLPVMDHIADYFKFFIGKGGNETRALEVFEALKGKGYCSVEVYNILIDCLHNVKEVKRALSLFEEIKCSNDFEPDENTYNFVITCYVDDGDVREACSFYNKMKEMSWTPSVEAYCSLVKGLCKIGEIEAALTLVKDCLGSVTSGPAEFKYTLTVLDACRLKNPEKVLEVLDEMIEQGYRLEVIIYCAIIHGFCKYARSTEARKVFAVLRDRGLLSEANFIAYEELLNEHLKKMTAGLVISGLKFWGLESKLKLTSAAD